MQIKAPVSSFQPSSILVIEAGTSVSEVFGPVGPPDRPQNAKVEAL